MSTGCAGGATAVDGVATHGCAGGIGAGSPRGNRPTWNVLAIWPAYVIGAGGWSSVVTWMSLSVIPDGQLAGIWNATWRLNAPGNGSFVTGSVSVVTPRTTCQHSDTSRPSGAEN